MLRDLVVRRLGQVVGAFADDRRADLIGNRGTKIAERRGRRDEDQPAETISLELACEDVGEMVGKALLELAMRVRSRLQRRAARPLRGEAAALAIGNQIARGRMVGAEIQPLYDDRFVPGPVVFQNAGASAVGDQYPRAERLHVRRSFCMAIQNDFRQPLQRLAEKCVVKGRFGDRSGPTSRPAQPTRSRQPRPSRGENRRFQLA